MNYFLSKKSIYGIKALIYTSKREHFSLLKSIAEDENIPQSFLKNIFIEFQKNGLVYLRKGQGYKLAKPANEINLYTIVEILQGPLISLPCVNKQFFEKCDDCSDVQCFIGKNLIVVKQQLNNHLRNISLSSI